MKKAIKNHAKIDQKSMTNRSKIGENRGLEASWGILGHLVASLGVLRAPRTAKRRPKTRLGASWLEKSGQHGSNLAPKTEPKSKKIEAKIDQNFEGSWGQIFSGFWWILEATWSQVGTKIASKIDPNFERRFFEKTLFSFGKTMILKVLGV